MITANDCDAIVDKILQELDIPSDIYRTWTYKDMQAFSAQYLKDDEYIVAMVDIELATSDTSNMDSSDIEDARNYIIEEVWTRLDSIRENYYSYQNKLQTDAYSDIVNTLTNANLANVVDVSTEYDPADPDVGIYNEERRIVFTLSNGFTITFDVTFDD